MVVFFRDPQSSILLIKLATPQIRFDHLLLFENTISLKYAPLCPIDNKSAVVQVIAYYLTGDKTLVESMPTKLCEAIWCH